MPLAWTCAAYPELHGSFLQSGLTLLSKVYGVCQPDHRFACPVCMTCGEPGYLRPAEESEAAALSRQSQEA